MKKSQRKTREGNSDNISGGIVSEMLDEIHVLISVAILEEIEKNPGGIFDEI